MGKISINDYASLFWPKIQIFTKIATNCFDIKKFYADLGLFISLNPQNRTNAHLNILILSTSSLLKSAPKLSWQQFSPPQAPTPQMGNAQMCVSVPKKLSLKILKTNANMHNSYCARGTGKRFQKVL